MRKIGIFISFVLVALTFSILPNGCKRKVSAPVAEIKQDTLPPIGFFIDSLDVEEGNVASGEVFTSLMSRLGMSYDDALALVDVSDSIFDVKRLRAGNHYHAYYQKESDLSDSLVAPVLEYFVYEESKTNLIVFKCREQLSAWKFSKPIETVLTASEITINTSLWNDMIDAGISPLLIVSLSDIYAWTVDFFGLQKGDRFRVLYNRQFCEGELIDVDSIYYAEFIRDSTLIPAIYYSQGDSANAYWGASGESLKKAFLKAPLKFSRISSGFSYHRKHPVTGKVKAHTAVDYAAPTGTPVMSIGDGTVLSAGWGGGGGNTIKIRHNSVYTTAYLHLSRYASGIRAGAHVRQGQVIGYVGATGVATGPHLDFRVWKNGTPVNPLKMESPPTEPIRPENMPALDSVRLHYAHLLDSLKIN